MKNPVTALVPLRARPPGGPPLQADGTEALPSQGFIYDAKVYKGSGALHDEQLGVDTQQHGQAVGGDGTGG